MQFPFNKVNQLIKQVDSVSNLSIFGADYIQSPIGRNLHIQPTGFWAKITGIVGCSTSTNPSSQTDVEAVCCTGTGDLTTPYTAYTWIEVQPDSCGRWKEGTKTGIAYEVNDQYVSTSAIVWLMSGFADDFRFCFGGTGYSSAINLPTKCVSLPVGFGCEQDEDGAYTGRTEITYQRFAVLDIDCEPTSSGSL